MTVLNRLKPGLDEKRYDKAPVMERAKRRRRMDQQRLRFTTTGISSATLQPDLLINVAMIVDTKVVTDSTDAHVAPMTGFLAITGQQLGLLLNVKSSRWGWRRVAPSRVKQTS